ncbi:MAG: hypothetical protein DWQ01_03170 [Planctomycetota bacterium]|nr:MAG: hypothetical protein DWQ01_03170 [Planctomycetota bacterium]
MLKTTSRLFHGSLCSLGTVLLLLPACTLPGDATWSGAHLSAHAGGFYTGLDGDIKTTTKNPKVTGNFDVGKDTGQSDDQLNGQIGFRLGFAPVELSLTAFDYSAEGTGRFNGNFLGTPFTGRVRSDFNIRNIKAMLGLDVFNSEWLRVGAQLGVSYMSTDLELQDLNSNTVEKIDEDLPIPVVGIRADVKLMDELSLGGEIAGLDITVDDFDATYIDAMAGLHYKPWDHVEAFLGYRLINIQFQGPIDNSTDADVDLDLSGPFFGIGIWF